MINQIGSCAGQFVCIDQQCYEAYRTRWPARAQDIHLFWGMADAELFKPISPEVRSATKNRYGIPQGGRVLLYVGRLTRLKGVHLIIEAVMRLRRMRSEVSFLLVAGNGEEEDSLRKQVEAVNLGTCVRFLGRIPHEELPVLQQCCFDCCRVGAGKPVLYDFGVAGLRNTVVSTGVGIAPFVIQTVDQDSFLKIERWMNCSGD